MEGDWPVTKQTQALLEFDVDDATYAKYDAISFEALCRKAGVSDSLYTTFLEPVLLALLFVPPGELSAAVALSVLSNYVLMHQADFDVRSEQLLGLRRGASRSPSPGD